MDVDQDRLVDALGAAIRNGGTALGDVPELLKRVLTEGVWRDFTTRRRQVVHHDRFADFITTQPLAGLGSTVDLVQRIVAADDEASVLLRKALRGSRHIMTGTRRDYAVERLERDRPDLHVEVLAGRLSAHAAAVQAGFRPHTLTVRTDDMARAADALRRNLKPEQLTELARLLGEG